SPFPIVAPGKIRSKQPNLVCTGLSHHQRRRRHDTTKKQAVYKLTCIEFTIFGPAIAGRSDDTVLIDYFHGAEHETQSWITIETFGAICKKAGQDKIIRMQQRQILAPRLVQTPIKAPSLTGSFCEP